MGEMADWIIGDMLDPPDHYFEEDLEDDYLASQGYGYSVYVNPQTLRKVIEEYKRERFSAKESEV